MLSPLSRLFAKKINEGKITEAQAVEVLGEEAARALKEERKDE